MVKPRAALGFRTFAIDLLGLFPAEILYRPDSSLFPESRMIIRNFPASADALELFIRMVLLKHFPFFNRFVSISVLSGFMVVVVVC